MFFSLENVKVKFLFDCLNKHPEGNLQVIIRDKKIERRVDTKIFFSNEIGDHCTRWDQAPTTQSHSIPPLPPPNCKKVDL